MNGLVGVSDGRGEMADFVVKNLCHLTRIFTVWSPGGIGDERWLSLQRQRMVPL
jgi:hypothetical protein